MIYKISSQQLFDSNNVLVRDFSNSRFLNRLNEQEKIKAVKKFCYFRFATQPKILGA